MYHKVRFSFSLFLSFFFSETAVTILHSPPSSLLSLTHLSHTAQICVILFSGDLLIMHLLFPWTVLGFVWLCLTIWLLQIELFLMSRDFHQLTMIPYKKHLTTTDYTFEWFQAQGRIVIWQLWPSLFPTLSNLVGSKLTLLDASLYSVIWGTVPGVYD